MSALGDARVLLVGVGGLGSPAAIALARAGVGTIGLADDDEVELANIHRQILFDEDDVGESKVEAAARALARIAPGVRTHVHRTRFLPPNARELASQYDLVVEGSDNFATKFLAADACHLARVPIVHAAAVRWHGTTLAVSSDGAPCYRCLFEDIPREDAPNCAEAGVIGPVVGIVAALQADLALRVLSGEDVFGTIVTFDGKNGSIRRRSFARRSNCALCGPAPSISRIEATHYENVVCDF